MTLSQPRRFRRPGPKGRRTGIYLQLLANTLVAAAGLFIVGAAFSVIYAATGVFHFGVGAALALGAYVAYLAAGILHIPLMGAIVLALAAASACGWALGRWLFLPLQRRRASSLIQMLASLGAYIVVQECIALFMGDEARSLLPGRQVSVVSLLGARLTSIQLGILAISILVAGGGWWIGRVSRVGLVFRAVSSDPTLARISGINPDRVALGCFAMGGLLGGVSGIMVGLDLVITPTMGLHALLLGVVATLIGGVGSLAGLLVASLVVAFLQQFGVLALSSEWLDVIVFLMLIVIMLWRPGGVMGLRLRRS